jgi:hypothetical protein
LTRTFQAHSNRSNTSSLGFPVTEPFEPARFFKHRIVRPKYVRRQEQDAVPVIAKLPPCILEGSILTPGLLAQVLVAKYCDHLPLYRQESIYRSRHGVELSRQLLAQWCLLRPCADSGTSRHEECRVRLPNPEQLDLRQFERLIRPCAVSLRIFQNKHSLRPDIGKAARRRSEGAA